MKDVPSAPGACAAPSTRGSFARAPLAFALRVGAWYLVLLLLWIPGAKFYREGFVGAANVAVGLFGRAETIRFELFSRWQDSGIPARVDVAVLARAADWPEKNGRKQYVLAKPIALFYQPFTASVFLLALGLSVQRRWRERLARTAAALALLHGLMALAVWIDVACALAPTGGSVPDSSAWWWTLLRVLRASVTDWPLAVYLVTLLLWVAIFPWAEVVRGADRTRPDPSRDGRSRPRAAAAANS